MRHWQSTINRKRGVWTSEIRLRNVDRTRQGKVNKLLKLLREDMRETVL